MEEVLKNSDQQESRLLNQENNQQNNNQQQDFEDNSQEAIEMRQLQNNIDNGEEMQQLLAYQNMVHQHESEQEQQNKTGIPDDLKTGMENLSGVSLDDVKVHYNSEEPEKLNANAQTDGKDVHVGKGQEKHLPEELGHVIQQKKKNVQPTTKLNNEVPINDNQNLEKEAVSMGQQALKNKDNKQENLEQIPSTSGPIQRAEINEDANAMESLYKRKYKRLGSRSVYLTNQNGQLETDNNNQPQTKKLVKKNKLQILDTQQDPDGLPAGTYHHIKFMEVGADQDVADFININWIYGYAKDTDIKALSEYKDIDTIEADPNNPKQGKILPEGQDDPAISQSDVYQAAISDCYLHAAMISLVTSNPDQITNIFDIQNNGVTINFPGTDRREALTVNMSKNLFITPEGEPLYGGKKDSYLWPAFMQKAWAIYKGKYANLPMGTPVEILEMITGREVGIAMVNNNNTEQAWAKYQDIVVALNANKPITLGTERWTDEKTNIFGTRRRVIPSKDDHEGLGIAHVYSIQEASDRTLQRPEDDENATPDVTLTLRDPRTKNGDPFEIPFMSIMDPRKVNYILYGR